MVFAKGEVILGEFCHELLVADIDKEKIRRTLKKLHIERRMEFMLKYEIKKRFEERVMELVDVGVSSLWGCF